MARGSDEQVVDCDAKPFEPRGWEAVEHKKGGVVKIERRGDDLYIDGKKIELYFSESQRADGVIKGDRLQKEISKKEAMNACVLEYLLSHPELIPDSWKTDENGKNIFIFFWGTIYCDQRGAPCVRFLHWNCSRWCWSCSLISWGWCSRCPTAIASK